MDLIENLNVCIASASQEFREVRMHRDDAIKLRDYIIVLQTQNSRKDDILSQVAWIVAAWQSPAIAKATCDT